MAERNSIKKTTSGRKGFARGGGTEAEIPEERTVGATIKKHKGEKKDNDYHSSKGGFQTLIVPEER